MKFGRGSPERSKPVALPERGQDVTLVPHGGKGINARVLECGPDSLLVAIMVPIGPLSAKQLDGIVLEFVSPMGRVRLSGTTTIEDPSDPDVLRIEAPRSIEVLQEREYVRIRSARPALVYAGPNKGPVESYTVDLSGGGFLLAGPDTLKIGEDVQFTITLEPGKLKISGSGVVVRVDRQGRRAVAFKSITELERRHLIRFIFDCQRTERQRGLQNG
jgi:PilZ domain